MKTPKVTAIIPFYQKEKGILERAVRSVLAQKGFTDYEIIIVDDESPIPAAGEIAEFSTEEKAKIRILEQKNSGTGAARNKGLDNVQSGTQYVAFLDSDDEWTETHLENAVYALDQGYDFYFSDFKRTDDNETFFDLGGFIPEQHMPVNSERGLYAFKGDFFDTVIKSNFIAAPTVVYRHSRYPKLRFDENILYLESRLFYLSFPGTEGKIVFSKTIECIGGKGVNIYESADWDSELALEHVFYEINLQKYIIKQLNLSSEQKDVINERLKLARYRFAAALLHGIGSLKPVSLRVIFRQVANDPFILFSIFPDILKLVKGKIFKNLKI